MGSFKHNQPYIPYNKHNPFAATAACLLRPSCLGYQLPCSNSQFPVPNASFAVHRQIWTFLFYFCCKIQTSSLGSFGNKSAHTQTTVCHFGGKAIAVLMSQTLLFIFFCFQI